MKNGPVLSRVYDLICGKSQESDQSALTRLFETKGYNLIRRAHGILDKQSFPEVKWEEASESGNTSNALPIDSIRRALGFTDGEIAETHADDELLEREHAVLSI